MNLQLIKQMSILIYLPVPIGKNEGTPPRKPYSLLRFFATLFTLIGRVKSNGANKTYVLRASVEVRNIATTDACMETKNPPASLFQNKSYAKSL